MSRLVRPYIGENVCELGDLEVSVPRADAAERVPRDALVLKLFLAGRTYRQIAKHPRVKLSPKGVGNVINRQLADANPKQNSLGAHARIIYVERLESLLRASWPAAMRGDLRAIAACARVMRLEARFYGLGGEAVEDPVDPFALVKYREAHGVLNSPDKDKVMVQLRRQGRTLEQIGREVGMTKGGVSHALTRIAAGRPGRDTRAT